MKEHSKKVLPLVFLTFTFILSNLFLFEDGVASPVNKVCAQDITRIERVVQYNTPDILQSLTNVPFNKSVQKTASSISKYLLDNKINPQSFNRCMAISAAMKWRLGSPSRGIITILQKTNRSHQSSDDEPSLLIYS
jgi:hypothetical protein